MEQPTVFMEICHLGFKIGALAGEGVNSNTGCAFDAQRKFARSSSINANDLGGNTKCEQVSLFSGAGKDVLNLSGVYILSIANEALAIATDKRRRNWNAGDGNTVDTRIRAFCSSLLVNVGEQSRNIGTVRRYWDSLDEAREKDGASREWYQGQIRGLWLCHDATGD
jgi:hypothetical protein